MGDSALHGEDGRGNREGHESLREAYCNTILLKSCNISFLPL